MIDVRPVDEADAPALAALWMRAFHRSGAPDAVEGYLRRVFLEPPARDGATPSLVATDARGVVAGFIGALPRRMRFRGRPIRAVVATQLMVDPGPGRGLAAFALQQALFSGPQDLTFSDGSNDAARRLWERSGGDAARLFCLEWTRVLRPAGYAQHLLRGRIRAGRAGRRICRALDAAAACLPLGPLREPGRPLAEKDFSEDAVVDLVQRERCALRPDYDAPTLAWLLDTAAETRGHGPLRKRLCCDGRGEPVGWYVHYAKEGGISQVLQVGGAPRVLGAVLQNLFADALGAGAVAISGQVDPRWMPELTGAHATLACKGLDVLVHARDPEIVGAIHRGDALLTRLDGEWWLRFAVDFPPGDVPAGAGGAGPHSRRLGCAVDPETMQ